jgi:hypothetical protein
MVREAPPSSIKEPERTRPNALHKPTSADRAKKTVTLAKIPSPTLSLWPLSNGSAFDTADLPYVDYFLTRFSNSREFAHLSKPIANYMISKAADHDVLRHATISGAALSASRKCHDILSPEISNLRHLEHKQKTLQLVRRRLEMSDIDGPVAIAIAILHGTEMGVGRQSCARIHMKGLQSVFEYAHKRDKQSTLLGRPTLSPLVWLSWAMTVRYGIGQSTIEGDPVFDPLPFTAEYELLHRSWILEVGSSTLSVQDVEWGVAIFSLRTLLHRAFHIASVAQKYRSSSDYRLEQELTIQSLCSELERELDELISRPSIRQAQLEERNQPSDTPKVKSFLHYPPLSMRSQMLREMLHDYRTAQLYTSMIAYPQVGPGPEGSRRFERALEVCRTLASGEFDLVTWSHLHRGRLFPLFLCYLAFGEDFPREAKGALDLLAELLKPDWGVSLEEVINRWIEHCPGLSLIVSTFSTSLERCEILETQ